MIEELDNENTYRILYKYIGILNMLEKKSVNDKNEAVAYVDMDCSDIYPLQELCEQDGISFKLVDLSEWATVKITTNEEVLVNTLKRVRK